MEIWFCTITVAVWLWTNQYSTYADIWDASVSVILWRLTGTLPIPQMVGERMWSIIGMIICVWKPKCLEKSCYSSTFAPYIPSALPCFWIRTSAVRSRWIKHEVTLSVQVCVITKPVCGYMGRDFVVSHSPVEWEWRVSATLYEIRIYHLHEERKRKNKDDGRGEKGKEVRREGEHEIGNEGGRERKEDRGQGERGIGRKKEL